MSLAWVCVKFPGKRLLEDEAAIGIKMQSVGGVSLSPWDSSSIANLHKTRKSLRNSPICKEFGFKSSFKPKTVGFVLDLKHREPNKFCQCSRERKKSGTLKIWKFRFLSRQAQMDTVPARLSERKLYSNKTNSSGCPNQTPLHTGNRVVISAKACQRKTPVL